MEKADTGADSDLHERLQLDMRDSVSPRGSFQMNKKIEERRSKKETCLRYVKDNALMILTFVGIAIGFGVGFIVREFKPSEDTVMWIGLPGDIYMRLLKMCIVPLTACSMISGASRLNPGTNGKLGLMIVFFVVLTHVMAVGLSTLMSLVIRPGDATGVSREGRELVHPVETHHIFADLLRNIFPDNMVSAAFRQTVTKYVPDDSPTTSNNNNNNNTQSLPNTSLAEAAVAYKRVVTTADGVNILGLITISCVFGVAAGTVRDKIEVFLSFFAQTVTIVLIIMRWFLWLTPIGVISLIAESVSTVDDVTDTFSDLGLFVVTVTFAILIHWFISLPLLYLVVVRKNPCILLTSTIRAASISFAATNSVVAMPEIMQVCDTKLGIDKRVTRIAVPFTLTLNADGTSIFMAAAAFFVCRFSGFDLSADTIVTIVILTIVTCLAIPPVPSASIVIVIIILSAINAPIHNVALLFAMEWFLDRIRTALNCVSHLAVVALANRMCRNTLRRLDEANEDVTSSAVNSHVEVGITSQVSERKDY